MSGNVGLGTNKGSWNALTNAPAISNSTQNNSAGDYYTTSVAGTSSFTSRGKGQYFAVGDIVVYNGAVWTKNNQFSAEAGFGTPSNWKDAYDNHITSGTFANNVITLNQRDGGSFTIDLIGVGGSSVLYRDSVTVSASSGQNAFTLSASIDHEDKTQVFIDGVYQQKTGYSVSGTSLTFDNNVVVPQGSTVEIISFSSVALTESLANAKIFVGDSNANAIARTVSGDATLANTGALTLNTVPIAKGGTGATSASAAKTALSLNNVDNTSDASKPVSTATQTALDLKSNIASPTFTGTVGGITKAMVGLSNVDNTTDAGKPVSTATQSALDLKANLAGPTFTGNTSAANLTLTGYLNAPASFTIDPATHGDITGTVVIAGNLQVDGTQTTINSTTVSIDDLNLTLASGASSSSAANGAGITIDGASASMLYTHATTNFIFNKPIHIDSTLLVQADNGGVQNATLELIGRQNSAFGGDSRAAKSSIYSETSGAQYSANLVFKTNNSSNSLTERLRLNYNGDAIFSGDTEIITSSTPTLQLTQSGSTNYKGYIKLAGNDLEIRGSSGAMEFYNGSVDGNSSALTMSISSTGLATFQSSVQEKIKLIASSNEYSSLSFANNSGTTQWEISKNNTHDLYFYKGGYKMMLKADGKLGIGTASPVKTLDVQGQLAISNSSSSYWYLDRNDSSGNFDVINDSNQVKLSISSGGEAIFTGTIKQSAATSLLTLNDSNSDSSGSTNIFQMTDYENNVLFKIAQINGGLNAEINQVVNGNLDFKTNNTSRLTISSGGDVQAKGTNLGVTQSDGDYLAKLYQSSADGFLSLYTGESTPVERVRLSSYSDSWIVPALATGKVGIGRTNPSSKLHLDGSNYNTASETQFTITDHGNNYNSGDTSCRIVMESRYWSGDDNVSTRSAITNIKDNGNGSSGSAMAFHTTNQGAGAYSEKMRISSGGTVQIYGTASANSLNIDHDSGNNVTMAIPFLNTSQDFVIRNSSAGVNLDYAATSWVSASDENIKENITSLDNVLDKIKNIRCVNYNLKDEEIYKKRLGFIAQDFQENFEEVTSINNNDVLGLRYTETIPILLKAIQEQQTIIEDLKSRIETLEG
jgi:hypothetical protein